VSGQKVGDKVQELESKIELECIVQNNNVYNILRLLIVAHALAHRVRGPLAPDSSSSSTSMQKRASESVCICVHMCVYVCLALFAEARPFCSVSSADDWI